MKQNRNPMVGPGVEAEKAVLDVTHQQMGAWVADRWNFPKNLAMVIQHHHSPQLAGPYTDITSIVHAADILCRALGSGSGGDDRIPIIEDYVWDKLKLDRMDMQRLLESIEQEIEKASVFIQEM